MRYYFVSLFLVVVTLPLSTYAQSEDEEATAVFQEAVEAYDNNHFVEAAALFRKANSIRFNWKLLYNIGQSEAAAKRNGLALQALEEYLTRAGDEITVERREEVLSEIQRLKLIVGMLEVDAPAGSTVMVDGEIRDRIPLVGPVMISSGILHEVVVIFDDEEILRQNVRVSGGNTQRLVARPTENAAKLSGPSDATLPTESDRTSTSTRDSVNTPVVMPGASKDTGRRTSDVRPVGPVLVGIGGAVAGAGLVCGILAYRKGTDLDDKYSAGVPEAKKDKVEEVDNMALTADILIPLGAATAVAGVVIWLVQRKKAKGQRASIPAAIFAPYGMGVGIAGRF